GAFAGGAGPGPGRGAERAGRPVAPGPARRPARRDARRRRRGGDLPPRDRPRPGWPARRRPAGGAAAVGAPRVPRGRAVARRRVHPHRGRRGARGGDGRGERGSCDRRGGVMRAWAVFKKELRVYFSSPIAYAVLAIFSIISGWFFYNVFAFYVLASMQ